MQFLVYKTASHSRQCAERIVLMRPRLSISSHVGAFPLSLSFHFVSVFNYSLANLSAGAPETPFGQTNMYVNC